MVEEKDLNNNISALIDKEPEDLDKELLKKWLGAFAFVLTILGIAALIGTGIEAAFKWMWGY